MFSRSFWTIGGVPLLLGHCYGSYICVNYDTAEIKLSFHFISENLLCMYVMLLKRGKERNLCGECAVILPSTWTSFVNMQCISKLFVPCIILWKHGGVINMFVLWLQQAVITCISYVYEQCLGALLVKWLGTKFFLFSCKTAQEICAQES